MDEVPEHWRQAAEEVRAHLCLLRGGAPFLSPADAWQLVTWLEAGVEVRDLLLALERAASTRRKTRARTPLSLVAAKRHLGRPSASWFAREVLPPGLDPVVRSLDLVPAEPWEVPLRRTLVGRLSAAPPGEDGLRQAVAAAREFLDALWTQAPAPTRRSWLEAARAELGDLVDLVDDQTAEALIEETARDTLRGRYPALSAATLAERSAGAAPG